MKRGGGFVKLLKTLRVPEQKNACVNTSFVGSRWTRQIKLPRTVTLVGCNEEVSIGRGRGLEGTRDVDIAQRRGAEPRFREDRTWGDSNRRFAW